MLAEAIARLADSDPELAGLEEHVHAGLQAVKKGKLVSLRIPDSFGPDD